MLPNAAIKKKYIFTSQDQHMYADKGRIHRIGRTGRFEPVLSKYPNSKLMMSNVADRADGFGSFNPHKIV